MNKVFSNANSVAQAVKTIIDDFWRQDITRDEAIVLIRDILSNSDNRARVFRGDKYTAVFENVMGRRRLAEFADMKFSVDNGTQK